MQVESRHDGATTARLPADVAMHAQKTVGQYSAIEEGAQLPLNKVWNRAIPLPLHGQKRLQMLRDNSVEGICLGIPGLIDRFGIANEKKVSLTLKTAIGEYRKPNGGTKGCCITALL